MLLNIIGFKVLHKHYHFKYKELFIVKKKVIIQFSINLDDLIKQNDEFYFDEEIYLDRFLYENSKKYLDIRTQNRELKAK